MRLPVRARFWLRGVLRRDRLTDEMNAEMRDHMERRADDLLRTGLSPEEARRRARAEFGPVSARQEECREALGLRLIDELRSDVRYAFRQLRQSPAFTVVAVLSIGHGLGANVAIFTLMESALWKSVAVKDPAQLRLLAWSAGPQNEIESSWGSWEQTSAGVSSTIFSNAVFEGMRRGNKALEPLFAFKRAGHITAIVDGQAERVDCFLVSGEFFEGLGVPAVAGRVIDRADDRRGDPVVAVISYGWWQRRFGLDASAIGRTIQLNRVPLTIIGVTPPDFRGIEQGESPDIYVPLSAQPAVAPNQWADQQELLDDPNYWWLQIMGRLPKGADESAARSSLDLLLDQTVRSTIPKSRDIPRLRLMDGARGLDEQREQLGKPLFVLAALVAVVLLIACVNVAGLLVSRASNRQREIAMRLALGAVRRRIARQLLTEGLVLSALGGAAGIALGYWTRNGIPILMATPWRPRHFNAEFDLLVFAISLALAVLTGVLFSIAPMWQASRHELTDSLRGGRATSSLPKVRAGKALVMAQIALSVLLVAGAGLFTRTLLNLKSAELGFQPERIVLFNIDPPRTQYAGESRKALFERLERNIGSIPGIQSATLSSVALISASGSRMTIRIEGRPEQGDPTRGWYIDVGDRFFETMGIPVLSGRALDARDREGAPRAVVVNRRFAELYFPAGDAVGKTFRTGKDAVWTIVGICGDAHYNKVQTDVPPTFYRPYRQTADSGFMTFEVKSAANSASLLALIREAVREVDADLTLFDIRTQQQQVEQTFANERLFAALASAFGILALVLGAVGVYGVTSYGVSRRTAEFGIRVAMGARSRDVLWMNLREIGLLAAFGIAAGLLASFALSRFIATFLYGLPPADPGTLSVAAFLVLAIALAAAWLPAYRASRADPMAALRSD